jgi:basic amino acid/polyamine antiporter, APA family
MKRRLGLGSATALVIANMIGVGVFTTSGFALAHLGRPEPVLLAWLLGGAVAMCGALSYGALARRIPVSGGEYTFLSATIHPLAGFVAGWVSMLAGFTAPIAVAALTLAAYLSPLVGEGAKAPWIGTAAVLGAGLAHGLRLRPGIAAQNAAVCLELFLITGFLLLGLHAVPERLDVSAGALGGIDPGAFAVTLIWISFSYSGWNAAVYLAGEVRDPARNLARSLWLGTVTVTVAYVALNAVFLSSAPAAALAGRADVAAVAASALGGAPLRRAVSALVSLALLGSISAMMMAGPRVYARMAEDGLLPRPLGRRQDVPTAAVVLQVVLAVTVVWLSGLRALLGYVGFTLGLSSAATVAGLLRLRWREGVARVPIPGYPLVPLIYLVVTLGSSCFMALRAPGEAAMGLLTAATGLPLWFWLHRSPRRRPPRLSP